MREVDCRTCRAGIEEAETGEHLTEEVRSHIAACAVCRAFRAERATLRQLVGSLAPVVAPPDFDFRLRARLARSQNVESRSFFNFSFTPRALAVAASLLIVVAASALFYRSAQTPAHDAQLNVVADATPVWTSAPRVETNPTVESTVATRINNVPNAPKRDGLEPSSENIEGRNQVAKNRRNKAEQSAPANRSNSPTFNNELSVGAARVITPKNSDAFFTNGQFELPVRSSAQPIRIMLNDKFGSTRAFSLESVTFGSQDIIQRGGLRPVLTSQKIW